MYLTSLGAFPPKTDKKKAAKQLSFFVFQIITYNPEQEDIREGKRKRDSLGSTQSLNSDLLKSSVKKTKEGEEGEENMSVNSAETEEFHLPTRIGEVCQTMRYQILSRAFYGWLAYCRHLGEVRKHLSNMVYTARPVSYPNMEAGVTPELWASLHDCDVINEKEQIMYHTYYGGIDPAVRPEVWMYILGHHKFGDTAAVRRQKDENELAHFRKTVSTWEKVEQYILSHDKSKFTPVIDDSQEFSSSGEAERVEEEEAGESESGVNGDTVDSLRDDDVVDDVVDDDDEDDLRSARSGVTSPASDTYLTPVQDVEEEELSSEYINGITQPPTPSTPETVVIDGVEYSDEVICTIDLNFHRIDKDVQRCDRNYSYFTNPNLAKLRRIMCTYVWENLEIGYLQGMCDILAPLLVILDNESLAYSCFKNLMVRMNMNFPHGGLMDNHFANMRSLIQILDSELFEHMHQNGDYSHFYFSYRWFLLDFKRELEYEDVFRVWEGIWAAYHCTSNHFTHFIALALVEHYRDIILDNNMDFTDIIKFFNEMAERHDGRKILKRARQLVHRLQTLIDS